MKTLHQRLATVAPLLLTATAAFAAGEAYPSPADVRPLLIGSEVPAVEVLGLDGTPVDLKAAVGSKDAVVIFYRGGW